jgi:hemerythrin superfamily protein
MDPRETLTQEHRHVEALLERMSDSVRIGDPRALCEAWNRFDKELNEHMRFEEEELLPRFAEVDPPEARALLAEHQELRRLLGELGVGVELHSLRADVVEQLFARLRAHAKREDQILYPWAVGWLAASEARAELAYLLDEVKLKLHLLGMDARDAYQDLRREAEKLGHKTAHASRESYAKVVAGLRELTRSLSSP